jgi:hypothetical protein
MNRTGLLTVPNLKSLLLLEDGGTRFLPNFGKPHTGVHGVAS